MLQGESSEWREIASAFGMEVCELERFLPALNGLAKAYFTARVHDQEVWSRAPTTSGLSVLGLTQADLRSLLDRGLVMADAKQGASRRIALTGAGLALLQAAIPLGAIRPVYDRGSSVLRAAGHIILEPAVQRRNLSKILVSLEDARWARRVEKPLAGRRCAGDSHSLRTALSKLNGRQRLIDFHARDGAATWNWRREP